MMQEDAVCVTMHDLPGMLSASDARPVSPTGDLPSPDRPRDRGPAMAKDDEDDLEEDDDFVWEDDEEFDDDEDYDDDDLDEFEDDDDDFVFDDDDEDF